MAIATDGDGLPDRELAEQLKALTEAVKQHSAILLLVHSAMERMVLALSTRKPT